MDFNFKNNDVIITTNQIKNYILRELTAKKKFLNLKFYTLKEFKNQYFGTYSYQAIYFLVKHYGYTYENACEVLDNIFIPYDNIKELYETLLANNLLIINNMFKKTLKNIYVIGYEDIDPYLKKELNRYNTVYQDITLAKKTNLKAFCFTKQIDEVVYVASKIREDLKNKDINDIYLVNVSKEYENDIRKVFDQYNIPINLSSSKTIYGTLSVANFLKKLKETHNILTSLEVVKSNTIKNKIIEIINNYNFVVDIDDIYIKIIEHELKKAIVPKPLLEQAINVIDINDMFDPDNTYYLMGCTLGNVPKLVHDDDFINDKDKKKLGILTSLEKLIINKNMLKKKFTSFTNLTITYKEKDYYQIYCPSPLLGDLEFEIIKNPSLSYKYSHEFNQLLLSEKLDRYINFNEYSDELKLLLNTYPNILYNSYKNDYNYVTFANLEAYLKGRTNLSYSSLNNYFLCAFRFYIANILKLDPFEDTFAILIGNLFHDCLSKMYNADFDLRTSYDNYLKDKKLNAKEKFFCEKLYKTLEFIIDTIHYQEKYSQYDKVLTEQRININKSSKLSINFLGFVDKIKYYEEENGKWLVAIIDYKTGNVETTLDNINYGLHLQLPVYIYLTTNGLHRDLKVTGFYLQKILNNPVMDSDSPQEDYRKALRLEGYTLDDEDIISKFDKTYETSEVIKGMGLTSKGFSRYAKLVSEKDIQTINNLVDTKIDEVITAIEKGNFAINPKRLNGELVGCQFCHYKELCYRREENIQDLEYKKAQDILNSQN